MRTRVRPADPSKLFRGGGRTLGELARLRPVPDWVPSHLIAEYQLTSLLDCEHAAAKSARSVMRAAYIRKMQRQAVPA